MAQANALQLKAQGLNTFLMARKHTLGALVAKHMTPERLVKGFMAAASRNPRLLECTPMSVLNACIVSAELGLDIGRPRGGMHVVPFRNKGVYEVTVIPDYRGLIDLAYRSGMVLSVEADVVRQLDKFDYQRGTDSYLIHKPATGNRGDIIGFYAVAHIKEGRPVFEYLPVADVNSYRDRSKAKNDGPWVTDYEAMGKKTCVRRLTNWLPQNPETDLFQRAVELDSRADVGESISDMFDLEIDAEDNGSRTDKMKDKLKDKKDDTPPTPDQPELPAFSLAACQERLAKAAKIAPEALDEEYGLIQKQFEGQGTDEEWAGLKAEFDRLWEENA